MQNRISTAIPDQLSKHQKQSYRFGDTGFLLTGTIVAAFFTLLLTDILSVGQGAE